MPDVDLGRDVVAKVRDAIDAIEIVGEHVRLKRRGRRFVGLCPFHDEKTPSFSVDPENGLYYCFGCHAGGDMIDFVMRLERLEFPEAVEQLARRYGVPLPARSPHARRRHEEAENLRSLLGEAQTWFTRQLASDIGRGPREELSRRGFGSETWAEYGFGLAPEGWRGLLDHLRRNHPESAIIDAGLAVRPEGGGNPYDRFRGRITFPIHSSDGRLVAFGGRAYGDGEPKYLNSPESPLFRKRSTLFALHRARRDIGTTGYALVVEGYFDCLSLHRAGITQTVATLGTALTEEHARLLRRSATRILLCYDGDDAGRRAAVSGARVLLEAGLEVAMVVPPPGKDPDDIVREEGPEAFRSLLEQPVGLLDFLLEDLPPDPAARRRTGVEFAEIIGSARDPVLRFSLLEDLARRLDLPLEVLRERAGGRGKLRPSASGAVRQPLAAGEAMLVRLLLGADGEIRRELLEAVDTELLRDLRIRRVFEIAASADLNAGEPVGRQLVALSDDPKLHQMIAELGAGDLAEVTTEAARRQLRLLRQQQDAERGRRLKPLIEEAEQRGDHDRVAQLQAELIRLRQKNTNL
jgi:DNA primase